MRASEEHPRTRAAQCTAPGAPPPAEGRLRRHASIAEVDPVQWNRLAGGSPFLRHEFLAALERTGCVGDETAWRPAHLTLSDPDGALAGAMPLYVKHDSRGEFVFDWGWAEAYARAGLQYYPKLVASVPFTPASGARLLSAPGTDAEAISRRLARALRELTVELGASSAHVLFPVDFQSQALLADGFVARKSCQFHWNNRGYRDFEDFLARFSSAKRKKVRRERRRIAEAGIVFDHLRGDQLEGRDWDAVLSFYTRTFLQYGRSPYLNRAFFEAVAATMPAELLVILARHGRRPIGAAICFRGADTLYGRYWGSLADFHSLHFETCYYQGIEYCIREQLRSFEPGTQGEHKVARGFEPVATWSNHWVANAGFRRAVTEFVAREAQHVDAYMNEVRAHLPFRQEPAADPSFP